MLPDDAQGMEAAILGLRSDDPTEVLLAICAMRDMLNGCEREAVTIARGKGMSWEQIALRLGQARQSVWKRYKSQQGFGDDDRYLTRHTPPPTSLEHEAGGGVEGSGEGEATSA